MPDKSRRAAQMALALLAASVPLTAGANTEREPPRGGIASVLKKEIARRKTLAFDDILRSWEYNFGTKAVPPLLRIAADKTNDDPDRYLAVMGAAKLGGMTVAPKLVKLLEDPSWMIRTAALRALTALNHPETAEHVLPLLRDPSLIVRTEAVEAISRLRPPGAKDALLSALEDSANYHQGKAQWVPARALQALVKMGAKDTAPKLRPLLFRTRDPELQKQTVQALESLTGRKLAPGAPLAARIDQWKAELARK